MKIFDAIGKFITRVSLLWFCVFAMIGLTPLTGLIWLMMAYEKDEEVVYQFKYYTKQFWGVLWYGALICISSSESITKKLANHLDTFAEFGGFEK